MNPGRDQVGRIASNPGDMGNQPLDSKEPELPPDDAADTATKARRQRALTIAAIAGAVVVGALLFTAGGGSSSPTVPSTAASLPTTAVTTGPPGPTAPIVSVVESTPIGPDAMAIGSSGTFSTVDWSGIVTVRSAQWQEIADSAGGVLPVIEVEIQVTTGQLIVTAAYFGLQDSKGHVYPPLSGVVADGELASGQLLAAGGQVSGLVAFDAPRQPLTLRFSGSASPALLTWRMPE